MDEIYDVAQLSYRLTLIPDALRGRVTSAFRLLTFSADSLGIALTGVLLQQLRRALDRRGDRRGAARAGGGGDT